MAAVVRGVFAGAPDPGRDQLSMQRCSSHQHANEWRGLHCRTKLTFYTNSKLSTRQKNLQCTKTYFIGWFNLRASVLIHLLPWRNSFKSGIYLEWFSKFFEQQLNISNQTRYGHASVFRQEETDGAAQLLYGPALVHWSGGVRCEKELGCYYPLNIWKDRPITRSGVVRTASLPLFLTNCRICQNI